MTSSELSFPVWAAIVASSVAAGIINALAGGGTLLSFPTLTLLAGMPGTIANATNSFALWPSAAAAAWRAGKTLRAVRRTLLIELALISLVGGCIGAGLLAATSERTFSLLIPVLIGLATVLFAFTKQISAWTQHHLGAKDGGSSHGLRGFGIVVQFLIAIYGGYFGAGMGVLMLAGLTWCGLDDLHEANALKSFLGTLINASATVVFVWQHQIDWTVGPVMALSAIVGGYTGMMLAQRISASRLKQVVVIVGALMTAYYSWRAFVAV